MGLPAELRNRIYEIAFDIKCEYTQYEKGKRCLIAAPGLLLACKQTYAEGLKIFYSSAKFRFSSKSRAVDFLSRVAWKNGHGSALKSVTRSLSQRHELLANSEAKYWSRATYPSVSGCKALGRRVADGSRLRKVGERRLNPAEQIRT
ncbi:uncharacterized protein MYCFIDRAFT_77169 [Pseudocercospora fijiensis CIRAD86]|uniref:Uncharacterized protein n=1 Tax=Pseudocercospora fijiensis (strain CIRAD86) TaxID=383855 RepID=M3AR05_PSEFD|nr:uncharacterized protein MYCFIDRAFT_77169 [Pseudocercospora fijiensis CIRAD86]EME87056.1 hypothetical protein MYCFIDRAFT_77169 [Pseudocercospora fijiensis CIRAD86]